MSKKVEAKVELIKSLGTTVSELASVITRQDDVIKELILMIVNDNNEVRMERKDWDRLNEILEALPQYIQIEIGEFMRGEKE